MIHTTNTTTTQFAGWTKRELSMTINGGQSNMVSHLFSFRSCFVLFKKSYFTFLGWAEGGSFL